MPSLPRPISHNCEPLLTSRVTARCCDRPRPAGARIAGGDRRERYGGRELRTVREAVRTCPDATSGCARCLPGPRRAAPHAVTIALRRARRPARLLRRPDPLRHLQLPPHRGDQSCRFCPEGAVHVDPGLAQGHADLGMRVPHSGCCSSSGADQDVSRRETNCPRDGTVFGRLFACRMSQL